MTGFVNNRARLLASAALVGALLLGASRAPAQHSTTPNQAPQTTPSASDSALEVLRLINAERLRARLQPLRADRRLSAVSLRLAENMARQNRFVWTVGGKKSAQLL